MAIRVVITNLNHGQDYSELAQKLRDKGFELVWTPPRNYSPAETVRVVKGYDAVIAGGEKYDRYALDELKDDLKILVRHGAGVDNIDLDTATEFGIPVTNGPGRNARAVAEHAIGLMICLTRQICSYDSQIRQGLWVLSMTRELYGKTVGLIGFGAIGKWVARLLKGFDCYILAHDITFNADVAADLGVRYADVEDILPQADFISLHLPLTKETASSIGTDFFSKMKRSAYFINTARGKIVREEELITALQNQTIAGAGLDVYANPPLAKTHPFCSMDNVILSPHTSAVTVESMRDMIECSLTDLMDFFEGRTPSNLLNPGYKLNVRSMQHNVSP